jgi:hypothetical protein
MMEGATAFTRIPSPASSSPGAAVSAATPALAAVEAALAQNGDGLRADQAGAADDDDLHGLPSIVDDWRPLEGFECE